MNSLWCRNELVKEVCLKWLNKISKKYLKEKEEDRSKYLKHLLDEISSSSISSSFLDDNLKVYK